MTSEEVNQLAEEITGLARDWSGGDAELLRQAEQILARTRYLGGNRMTHRYTWREARDVLTESSGMNVNFAQQVLDDLAHWGPGVNYWSYYSGSEVQHLYYAGVIDGQPCYLTKGKDDE
jgi:hypothetical protein